MIRFLFQHHYFSGTVLTLVYGGIWYAVAPDNKQMGWGILAIWTTLSVGKMLQSEE